MSTRKELIAQAEKMGKEAEKAGMPSAPASNKAFMDWKPSGSIFDNNAFRLSAALYKAYAKGWVLSRNEAC